jgi:hypothetical protein
MSRTVPLHDPGAWGRVAPAAGPLEEYSWWPKTSPLVPPSGLC